MNVWTVGNKLFWLQLLSAATRGRTACLFSLQTSKSRFFSCVRRLFRNPLWLTCPVLFFTLHRSGWKGQRGWKISVFVEETGLLLFLHSDSSSLAGHVSPRPIRGGGDARQLYKSSVEAPREAGMKNNRKLHTDHSSKDSFNLLIFFYT